MLTIDPKKSWETYKFFVDKYVSPLVDFQTVVEGSHLPGSGLLAKVVAFPAAALVPIALEQVYKAKIPKGGSYVDLAEEFCKVGFYMGLGVATVGITADSLSSYSKISKNISRYSFWGPSWAGKIPVCSWLLRLKIPVLARTVYHAWRLDRSIQEALSKNNDRALFDLFTQLQKDKKILQRFCIPGNKTGIDQKVVNLAKRWREEGVSSSSSHEDAKKILKTLQTHLKFHFWKDLAGLGANACWVLNKIWKWQGWKGAAAFDVGQGSLFLVQEMKSRRYF